MRRIKPSPSSAAADRFAELRRQGQDIINLAIGEPDFDTPAHIRQAAGAAIERGETRYTPVAGTLALRQAILRPAVRRRVRTLSDRADEQAHVNFTAFVGEVASHYAGAILRGWLVASDLGDRCAFHVAMRFIPCGQPTPALSRRTVSREAVAHDGQRIRHAGLKGAGLGSGRDEAVARDRQAASCVGWAWTLTHRPRWSGNRCISNAPFADAYAIFL